MRALALERCRYCTAPPPTLEMHGRYVVCCRCNKINAELDQTEAYEHEAELRYPGDGLVER